MLLKRALYALAVLVLVAAPVDTLDFAGGALGFKLTPFFVLSLIYLVYYLFFLLGVAGTSYRGTFLSYLNLKRFWTSHFVLLIWLGLTIFTAIFTESDPYGLALRRLVLVSWLILFGLLYVISLGNQFYHVLVAATKGFLLLDALAVIVEGLVYYDLLSPDPHLEMFISIWEPGKVGGLPRFSGLVGDPNRAAVNIVLMLFSAYLFSRGQSRRVVLSWYYYVLGVVLVLATISRTGLVYLLLFGVTILRHAKQWRRRSRIVQTLAISTFTAAALGFALWGITSATSPKDSSPLISQVTEALAYASERRTSTRTHLNLWVRGWEVSSENFKSLLLGKGWGTEYVYTQDFFPGNKYGNFHSGYVSILVQTGILGLFFYAIYLLQPAIRDFNWVLFTIGIAWINLFYQYNAEALYWILLIGANQSLSRQLLVSGGRRRSGDPG